MIRVFASDLSIIKAGKRKKSNKRYNDIVCGIQIRGGEIISANLFPFAAGEEGFLVMYEDNNNNDEIEKFLETFIS